jgi:glutamate dehydrogenase
MADDLSGLQRAIATAVFSSAAPDAPAAELVGPWAAQNQRPLERAEQLLGELRAVPKPDVAMLSVALRELRGLG